jgi:hypothetical protein
MTCGPTASPDQNSHREREEDAHTRFSQRIWWAGFCVLVLFVLAYILNFYMKSEILGRKIYFGLSGAPQDWSAFGEYIGGSVGAVMAFLALWLLLRTMEIQVREFTYSRKAMESSAESLREQIKILAAQRRDENYFYCLQYFNQTLSLLAASGRDNRTRLTGRQVLQSMYDELVANAQGTSDLSAAIHQFEALESRTGGQSEYYFRAAALVLDYVCSTMGGDKFVCAQRFRAQLTEPETCLLYYHALTPRGARMKAQADELRLFESLPPGRLLHVDHAPKYAQGQAPSVD